MKEINSLGEKGLNSLIKELDNIPKEYNEEETEELPNTRKGRRHTKSLLSKRNNKRKPLKGGKNVKSVDRSSMFLATTVIFALIAAGMGTLYYLESQKQEFNAQAVWAVKPIQKGQLIDCSTNAVIVKMKGEVGNVSAPEEVCGRAAKNVIPANSIIHMEKSFESIPKDVPVEGITYITLNEEQEVSPGSYVILLIDKPIKPNDQSVIKQGNNSANIPQLNSNVERYEIKGYAISANKVITTDLVPPGGIVVRSYEFTNAKDRNIALGKYIPQNATPVN